MKKHSTEEFSIGELAGFEEALEACKFLQKQVSELVGYVKVLDTEEAQVMKDRGGAEGIYKEFKRLVLKVQEELDMVEEGISNWFESY